MFPNLIRAIVAQGSTLCVHSWNHPHMLTLDSAHQFGQITTTYKLLVSLVGAKHVKFWRAPYGQSRPRLDLYAEHYGLTPLGYNTDGVDWSLAATPEFVVSLEQKDLATVPAKQYQAGAWTPPGALVALLHDAQGENHTRNSVDRWASSEALAALCDDYTMIEP